MMKSFIRITMMLVGLTMLLLNATAPLWADEPTPPQPAAPIETQANTKIFLPIILRPPLLLLANGNFEGGNTIWTLSSTHNLTLITQSYAPNSVTIHSGSWGAWLGGQNNETNFLQQQITIPASAPYLGYWHWIGSGDACGYDTAAILINGVVVHQYDLCYLTDSSGWVKKVVNLSAYAGQTVTFRLRVQNDVSGNSNLFVDDLAFQGTAALTSEEIAETVVKPAAGMEIAGGENEFSLPQP